MKNEKSDKPVQKKPFEFIGSTVECVTIDGVDTMLHPGATLQLDPDASFTKGLLERRLVRAAQPNDDEPPKTTRSTRVPPGPASKGPPASKKPASKKGKA